MLRKNMLLLLLLVSFQINSKESITNSFNIGLTIEPKIIDKTVPRGITINYMKYINKYFFWNFSGRIINKDYSSFWSSLGYNWQVKGRLVMPIDIGIGLKLKSIDFSKENQEGFNAFLHGNIGLWWYYDTNWSYTLNGTYNYNISTDNTDNIYINLGIGYLF